jgi:hypothetical protein
MRRALFALLVCAGITGCAKELYGTGVVYVWNGTDDKAEVTIEGRTTSKVSLRPQSGELVKDVIGGPYQIAIMKGGTMSGIVGTELVKERLTIVNVAGAACFARADISGLYSRKTPPAQLKQVYQGDTVFSIPEEIGVLPGERPPEARSKSAYGFFRIAVIPCALTKGSEFLVEDYLQKLK